MPLAHINYFSRPLQKMAGLFLAYPDQATAFPVVYLLHGLSDDYTAWQRRTTVELMADQLRIGVCMLDGARSFYTDMADGTGNHAQHILDSVAFVERSFRAIPQRTARGIQGLSMGGYGAMKLGLRHREVFGSIVSHSSAFDVHEGPSGKLWHRDPRHMKALFGDGPFPRREDVFHLAAAAAKDGRNLPAIAFDCGFDDFLLPCNREFAQHLGRLGLAHTYQEHPGSHNWDYWQAHVVTGLRFHCQAFATHGFWSDPAAATPAKPKTPAKRRR